MQTNFVGQRKANVPVGHGEESGRAFAVGDALLALRWAGLVQQLGYRLTFSLAYKRADEVLEIHIPPYRTPIARIYRGDRAFWLTDCLGHNRLFANLADALTWVVPLSSRERRVMLNPRHPSWLWPAQFSAGQSSGVWPKFKSMARTLARTLVL